MVHTREGDVDYTVVWVFEVSSVTNPNCLLVGRVYVKGGRRRPCVDRSL